MKLSVLQSHHNGTNPVSEVAKGQRPERAGAKLVLNDLRVFGPDCEWSTPSLLDANRYCKNLAIRHYENFSVASFLLPRRMRQHFYNVYAYCRWSDDLADETGSTEDSVRLLDWWLGLLERCFDECQATHPVFVALRETVRLHNLNREPFADLVSAFRQDQFVVRYTDDAMLLDYCRRSANPVGRILLQLANCSNETTRTLSDSICIGLQIANFCQDIAVDARRGRIYLPRSRFEARGVAEDEILAGAATSAMRDLVRDWCSAARTRLVNGLPLVKHGPRWLARDVQLFARGGMTLLESIAQAQFDVWTRPIEVTRSQKIRLLLKSIIAPRSIAIRTSLESLQ